MGKINSFEEMEVYIESFKFQNRVFKMTQTWPREEMYSLTDQIRRSSRSVGSSIAEAWGKRRYVAHFVNKLTDADAEQLETRHWLHSAKSAGYISEEDYGAGIETCKSVGRMLGKIIANPDPWIIKSK
mgnify:CR=1 FL=1